MFLSNLRFMAWGLLLFLFFLPTAQAGKIIERSFCVTPNEFRFDIVVSGIHPQEHVRITVGETPIAEPYEQFDVIYDSSTGVIASQSFIVQTFGTPDVDRWQDGPIADGAVASVGDINWRITGSILHGADPYVDGDFHRWVQVLGDQGHTSLNHPVTACEPEPPQEIAIDVPELRSSARPVIDGIVSRQEWTSANRLDLDNGFMKFIHDRGRLYVLIDMLGDSVDDAFRAGGGDQFWLLFDVDRDGVITPDVDLRYRLQSVTGHLRYETFCDGCLFGFNPPAAQTYSSRAEGFGCFIEDGSATFIPLSCNSHRVWELGIDLQELGMDADSDIRMGYLVSSGDPAFTENFPADLNDLSNYAQLTLEGGARRIFLSATNVGDPQFEISQAIQTPDNEHDLVAGKPTVARVWSAVEADGAGVFLYGQRGGIDLPGSPMFNYSFLAKYSEPETSRDSAIRMIPLPPSWAEGGTVDFDVVVRGDNKAVEATLNATIDFVPTRTPLFWTVPIRITLTGNPGSVQETDENFIAQSEQGTLTVSPLSDIEYVRRPTLELTDVTDNATLKLELRAYDQTMLLAWTIGLLLTGESPFDLPEQITGFNPVGYPGAGGSSDPVWNGTVGRIAWITENNVGGIFGYAHELNHNLDMRPATTANWGFHSRGCGASDDPAWPYGNSFTIQEVGVFWNGMNWRSVADNTPDYMSYCNVPTSPTVWISPYRWDAWLDLFRTDLVPLNLAAASVAATAASATPVDSFYVLGQVFPDGSGDLGQVLRQPGLPANGSTTGDHAVQVRDCTGAVVAEKQFTPSFVDVEGDPVAFYSYDVVLAAATNTCAIELRNGEEVLESRVVSSNTPIVNLLSPNGGEVWEGEVTVNWQAGDDDGDALMFVLLYSADGGRTWQPIASRLTGNAYTFDSSALPGSDDARVRIIATDGANTSDDDSNAAFRVVAKPPRVQIVAPADGQTLFADNLQPLSGLARDTFGTLLPDDALLWTVDGEVVGMGARADIFLAVGLHEIMLLYREGEATIASDTVVVTVRGASVIEDPADSLPGSIDILSVDTSIDGDSFLCDFVVRSGAEGLTDKSRYTCYLDFDDLESEVVNGCDANGDGLIDGTYRLGENNGCDTADVNLRFREGKKDDQCKGPAGTQCLQQEIAADGSADADCDGSVGGQPAVTCRIGISAPLAGIAAERDAHCAEPDDNCLDDVYAWFESKLTSQHDYVPDTDDNRKPDSLEEAVVIPFSP
jgi:hypothetical protein